MTHDRAQRNPSHDPAVARRDLRALVVLFGLITITGCGGSDNGAVACKDLPHPSRPTPNRIFFFGGQVTKHDACASLGNPQAITKDARGRETWSYKPGPKITFHGNNATTINGHQLPP